MSVSERCNVSMFEIRKTRFHEFCVLADRMLDHDKRENKKKHKGKVRVKAQDNWF